jgi:hypothetical protein
MAAKRTPAPKTQPRNLVVECDGKEKVAEAIARKVNAPWPRHGLAALEFQGQMTRGLSAAEKPDFQHYADDLKKRGEKLGGGDLELAGHLLASQAITLDAIFTEMARRSGLNMGEYINASERYMRLALKAQANSRATLEALAKLHQPREQTVRHVHVNEGGQAVIADQFHHHQTGGKENAETAEQPHAPNDAAAGASPALPSPDPLRNGMPIASGEGQPAMQMHGGKGSGAPIGNRNSWKHGGRSAETAATLALIRDLGQMLDEAKG